MKFHAARYGLTAGLGALTTGLLAIQFGYYGLTSCVLVGMFCYVVIPYNQAGDQT